MTKPRSNWLTERLDSAFAWWAVGNKRPRAILVSPKAMEALREVRATTARYRGVRVFERPEIPDGLFAFM